MKRFLLQKASVWLLAMVGAFLGLSDQAAADILFSQQWDGSGTAWASQNDTTRGGYGNYATVYDNFTLSVISSVDKVEWTGEYFNPRSQGTITGFTLQFYRDNAGQPGAVVATDVISGTAGETYLSSPRFYPTYSYSANISSFSAAAGKQYWLSIVPDVGYHPQWGWSTGTGGDGAGYQAYFGSGGRVPNDEAFTLSSAQVPEPGSLILLCTGLATFGGLGWMTKQKTKVVAAC